ncbi:NADH:FMN oxidoreductase [Serratia rubidaea]|uniref:NADH:FMN oxidoreductase n=1 Tax=Serratia rubidaea TaxID=61652 RepID=A0A447QJ30_SERRU|nr:NADH:FMN oxidoreductase [Serratia rubidaea]
MKITGQQRSLKRSWISANRNWRSYMPAPVIYGFNIEILTMSLPESSDVCVETLLKNAMRNTCSSVYIVSAGTSRRNKNAITITSFTSVSISPPIILFCVNKKSRFSELIMNHDRFSINFIHNEQIGIAQLCSGSDTAIKFKSGNWKYKEGVPYLSDANNVLFCSKFPWKNKGLIFWSVGK